MTISKFLPSFIAAVVAAAGGYWLGRSAVPAPAPVQPVAEQKAAPVKPAVPSPVVATGNLPGRLHDIFGGVNITDANIAEVTYRALEEADPVSRIGAMGVLLQSMTATNAAAVLETFRDITKRTGRRHNVEWGLMLRRYGSLAGEEAFEAVKPGMTDMAAVIEGMATVNADGADALIEKLGTKDLTLRNAWLTGLCRKNPELAMEVALSGKYGRVDGKSLLNQAIQTSGMEGAREAMQKALDKTPLEASSDPTFLGLFDQLAEAMFHRHWTSGTPGDMLPWLEKQKGEPYLTEKFVGRGAKDSMLGGNPNETISWLERMNEGNAEAEPVGSRGLYDALLETPTVMDKLDEASFRKMFDLLPQNGVTFEMLALYYETLNPERARALREAAPQGSQPQPVPVIQTPPPSE